MSMLPKIDVPTYEKVLPVSGKKVKFRPFLVKEQRLFLIAAESKDVNDILGCIKQVAENCVLTPGFDANELPTTDLEYLFLHLRAKSMGELVDLQYKCNNKVGDAICNHINPVSIDLEKIIVPDIDKKACDIRVTPKIGLRLKYPTIYATKGLVDFAISQQKGYKTGEVTLEFIEMIVKCLEYVYDDDKMFYPADESKEDLMQWFDTLPQKTFDDIEKFFNSVPQLSYETDFKCGKCGYTEHMVLKGLNSFFG